MTTEIEKKQPVYVLCAKCGQGQGTLVRIGAKGKDATYQHQGKCPVTQASIWDSRKEVDKDGAAKPD